MDTLDVRRFLVGGLVAGLLVSTGDGFLYGVLLAPETTTLLARLGHELPSGPAALLYPLMAFMVGFIGLWLALAARGTLGSPVRAAVRVAVAVWALVYVTPTLDQALSGMRSGTSLLATAGIGLAILLLALPAGAWAYQWAGEEHPAPPFRTRAASE